MSAKGSQIDSVQILQARGKTKNVFLRNGQVDLLFRDSITTNNGQQSSELPGKGALCAQISKLFFDKLSSCDINHHMLALVDERTLRCRPATMLPLEVVVRFAVAGSMGKRLGIGEGRVCEPPIVEWYLKDDKLADPWVNEDHIVFLGLLSQKWLRSLAEQAKTTGMVLRQWCLYGDLALWDIKLEYGFIDNQLVLADEISPDTCRLRDRLSDEIFDKDRYRLGLGDVMNGYQTILSRLQKISS